MRTHTHKLWLRLRRTEGQAFVEFVIVLPLLVMLVMGIVQFGLAFHNYLSITDATRVGARAAAVKRTSGACAAATTAIQNTVSAKQWSQVSSRITCTTPDGTDTGDRVIVKVDYPYSIGLPGDINFDGLLTATATERLE
jgi:Flp pilus assembly protein TadG